MDYDYIATKTINNVFIFVKLNYIEANYKLFIMTSAYLAECSMNLALST